MAVEADEQLLLAFAQAVVDAGDEDADHVGHHDGGHQVAHEGGGVAAGGGGVHLGHGQRADAQAAGHDGRGDEEDAVDEPEPGDGPEQPDQDEGGDEAADDRDGEARAGLQQQGPGHAKDGAGDDADDEEVQEAMAVDEVLHHGDEVLRHQAQERRVAGTKVHRMVGRPKSRTTGNRLPIQMKSPPSRMVAAKPATMVSGRLPVMAAVRTRPARTR